MRKVVQSERKALSAYQAALVQSVSKVFFYIDSPATALSCCC